MTTGRLRGLRRAYRYANLLSIEADSGQMKGAS